MKPWKQLGRAGTLTLHERDGTFVIRSAGRELMSSRRHDSEAELARLGLEPLRTQAPRVLVGGLGLGFTLRATLDLLSAAAQVVVAELEGEVVEWNKGPLKELHGDALSDPRVQVEVADVAKVKGPFHATLLDVDNGPFALTDPRNSALYTAKGLEGLKRQLAPYGVLAVWSASPDPAFLRRLERAGFDARAVPAKGHTLFVGKRRG